MIIDVEGFHVAKAFKPDIKPEEYLQRTVQGSDRVEKELRKMVDEFDSKFSAVARGLRILADEASKR